MLERFFYVAAHRRARKSKNADNQRRLRWFSVSFGSSAFLWLTPDPHREKIRAVELLSQDATPLVCVREIFPTKMNKFLIYENNLTCVS